MKLQSHSEVDLVNQTGTDEDVVRAARVSVQGAQSHERGFASGHVAGLIGHMMKNRHGSVFEHNVFTFRVHTPIFVAREFMRHRMFSYNEESARYKQLDPVFWIPAADRKLRQEGKPSAYKLVSGTEEDVFKTRLRIDDAVQYAYRIYQRLLDDGIAREVARCVLPVGIFTSFYATCNARALMSFLSLRIDSPLNAVPTHPQAEIQGVAEQMQASFAEKMPVTYAAFAANGRTAP
jgi:thymidylate synthase (FAD)